MTVCDLGSGARCLLSLGTDRLLRPKGGGRWFWRGGGGYNFKTSPFLGGKSFSGKKHEVGQIL